MCLERERSDSKITPRFLTELDKETVVPEKLKELKVSLERCWLVPTIRNLVLEELRESRLEDNQE